MRAACIGAAALGVFGGLFATTLFGAFTALCIGKLGDSYVADLVAAAPIWYVLPSRGGPPITSELVQRLLDEADLEDAGIRPAEKK